MKVYQLPLTCFLKCSAGERHFFSVFSVDICYNYRNLQEWKIHKCNSRLQMVTQQKNAVLKKAKHYNALTLYIKNIVNYFRQWPDYPKCDDDARKLGERNWRNAARNRDSWRKLLKKALAQNGLLCQWWWWNYFSLIGPTFFGLHWLHRCAASTVSRNTWCF